MAVEAGALTNTLEDYARGQGMDLVGIADMAPVREDRFDAHLCNAYCLEQLERLGVRDKSAPGHVCGLCCYENAVGHLCFSAPRFGVG